MIVLYNKDQCPFCWRVRMALKRVEHDLLQQALAAQRYNQRATAKQLGLTYDQLRGRLRKHGLLETATRQDAT